MHVIEIASAPWTTLEDFYCALLSALGAPAWNGHNPKATYNSAASSTA